MTRDQVLAVCSLIDQKQKEFAGCSPSAVQSFRWGVDSLAAALYDNCVINSNERAAFEEAARGNLRQGLMRLY